MEATDRGRLLGDGKKPCSRLGEMSGQGCILEAPHETSDLMQDTFQGGSRT